MRSQISFMQYSSDKAEKYGILFKSINSVRTLVLISHMFVVENLLKNQMMFIFVEPTTVLNIFAQKFNVIMIFEVEIFQWIGSTPVSLQQTDYFNMK